MSKFVPLVVIFFSFSSGFAQQMQQTHHEHKHKHTHGLEIEIGAGGSWNLHERELAPVLHLHMHKDVWHQVGFGIGYEIISGDHVHQSIHPTLNFHLKELWHFSIGPGVLLIKDEPIAFSTHFEAGIGFHAGKIKIGPFADYAWSRNDQHISLGVRLGF